MTLGLQVGLYTSPHLRDIRERIQISGLGPISEQEFNALAQRAEAAAGHVNAARAAAGLPGLSHFEALTALALQHFAEANVDVAVVETGMGGARDATNILPPSSVLASVITSIGMEHVEALGGSLRSIAEAKAGIAKEGRPIVLARQPEAEAAQVLEAVAGARGASHVLRAPEMVSVTGRGAELGPSLGGASNLRESLVVEYRGSEGQPVSLETSCSLVGTHQHDNLAAAVAASLQAAKEGGYHLAPEHIAAGIARTHLPGRLQVLGRPGAPHLLVLDGKKKRCDAEAVSLRCGHPFYGLVDVQGLTRRHLQVHWWGRSGSTWDHAVWRWWLRARQTRTTGALWLS